MLHASMVVQSTFHIHILRIESFRSRLSLRIESVSSERARASMVVRGRAFVFRFQILFLRASRSSTEKRVVGGEIRSLDLPI